MKKITGILIILILLIIVVFTLVPKNNGESTGNKVGATIFPIYDIAKNVAGDKFEVVLLLEPGASPHTYDPQPSKLKELRGAKTIFAIGHGLDNWTHKFAESLNTPTVTLDHDIDLRPTEEEHGDEHEDHEEHDEHEEDEDHDHEIEHEEHEEDEDHDEHDEDHHGHSHGPIDPHYWLSIKNAKQIAINVAEELGELDEENIQFYMDNAEAYNQQLDKLFEELQEQSSTVKSPNIISLHDAWYYFADESGFNVVGTFEPSAGKEPSPQYLANLEEEVEEHNVQVIFIEPQLSNHSIRAFAQDHNLEIATLDPLGGIENRQSYIDLMRYNVTQVVKALSN